MPSAWQKPKGEAVSTAPFAVDFSKYMYHVVGSKVRQTDRITKRKVLIVGGIKREPGWLYYVGSTSPKKTHGMVYRSRMAAPRKAGEVRNRKKQ